MDRNNIFLTETKESHNLYKKMTSQIIDAVLSTYTNDKAYAGPTPDELKKIVHVDNILPEQGLGWDVVLEKLKKQILPYFLKTPSTDYMAHLHSASLLECICTEIVLTTFNQSMDSWDQSPVATEIELIVIEKLCAMFGYNRENGLIPDGTFTSGGSQSNLTGLILARDWYCNEKLHYDVKNHGLPPEYRKFRVYTSCISHFSVLKSAHLLGLGYESVVNVPVDSKQRMDIQQLELLIQNDIDNGNLPFCVVATIGTTDFGSIDPINKISELCKKYGMYLHSDAAYGSGVIMSSKYKNRIDGLNKSDSITVDFHKMFMLPISCSAVLVKDSRNFDALTIHADYLNRTEDEEDGYSNLVDKSLQTTRRFDALKVWVTFQTRGQNGWSDLITTCMDNAQYLYTKLVADPDFEVVTEPEISSVVFRVIKNNSNNESIDDMNKRVRRSLIHNNGIVIGQTVCNGNVFLKFTLLNPLVTNNKLDELLELIKKTSLF